MMTHIVFGTMMTNVFFGTMRKGLAQLDHTQSVLLFIMEQRLTSISSLNLMAHIGT